jgi:hypothetical protein
MPGSRGVSPLFTGWTSPLESVACGAMMGGPIDIKSIGEMVLSRSNVRIDYV